MRILMMSDLHAEFLTRKQIIDPTRLQINFEQDVDVVLLAGDIHPGVLGFEFVRKIWKQQMIIMVAGNHEFYGRSLDSHYQKMREKAESLDIIFLQDSSISTNGVKFVGSTLWTDFNLFGNQPLAMVRAGTEMNDYQKINSSMNRKILPYQLLERHQKSRDFMFSEFQTEETVIAVTHHAPCELSVPERFLDDELSSAYASRLGNQIAFCGPKIWLHGHTHDSFDYRVGETRVVCNPYGYHGVSVNPSFNPGFVVEI